jgi:hypothetical protein
VSSAYSPVEVVGGITSGRSLMNRRKSMGPKILPCGTPEVTVVLVSQDTVKLLK